MLITYCNRVNQKVAALIAIAVVIPLAMVAAIYSGPAAEESDRAPEKLVVLASFYPMYEFAKKVGGDRADVSSLVPQGIEPHDWEPSAPDVARTESADIIVINGAGFESWASRINTDSLVDTSEGIDWTVEDGQINPHFWLDPVLAKQQVERIRNALAQADPSNADYYFENAASFSAELDSLHLTAEEELSDCALSDFIAFHDAFFHFARRYGLEQHSVHGPSPEGEILPQRIEEVVRLVDELGISVIYSEDLVDSRLADTIAQEIRGGRVLVLSPIEGIEGEEQALGIGYIKKMHENIANLKEGLECRP